MPLRAQYPGWQYPGLHINNLSAAVQAPAPEPEPVQTVELDQWILDFANLFREHTGLDMDRHIDLNNVGWDRIQARPGSRRFGMSDFV